MSKRDVSWLGLEGKAAIVTGGAGGIGAACAEGLAEAGARVAVADLDRAAGEKVAAGIEARFGGGHLFVETDVTSKAAAEALVRRAAAGLGGLDILVNNAGILIPRLLVDPAGREELSETVWDNVVAINQKGIYLCAQAAVREMIRNGTRGVVINMSSESGLEGSEGQSVYAATKGAIYALTRSWAKELGRHGIRVVGVAPGVIEATALRSEEYERAVAYTRGVTVGEFRARYKQTAIPLGRMGTPRDVANVVCFLASDRAAYVNGTTVNVSGGKSRG